MSEQTPPKPPERPPLSREPWQPQSSALARGAGSRKILFASLFILFFGAPCALWLFTPKHRPPPTRVLLESVDLSRLAGDRAASLDTETQSLESLGFERIADVVAEAAGEHFRWEPARLLQNSRASCFAVLSIEEESAPTITFLTAFQNGDYLLTTSRATEPEWKTGAKVQLAPGAPVSSLLRQHQETLATMRSSSLPETEYTEGRYAFHLARLVPRPKQK